MKHFWEGYTMSCCTATNFFCFSSWWELAFKCLNSNEEHFPQLAHPRQHAQCCHTWASSPTNLEYWPWSLLHPGRPARIKARALSAQLQVMVQDAWTNESKMTKHCDPGVSETVPSCANCPRTGHPAAHVASRPIPSLAQVFSSVPQNSVVWLSIAFGKNFWVPKERIVIKFSWWHLTWC